MLQSFARTFLRTLESTATREMTRVQTRKNTRNSSSSGKIYSKGVIFLPILIDYFKRILDLAPRIKPHIRAFLFACTPTPLEAPFVGDFVNRFEPSGISWNPAYATNYTAPFMENQTKEVEKFMELSVQNLVNQLKVVGVNDNCFNLVCSSQMLGSGKTHFGQAFLAVARSTDNQRKWRQKFPKHQVHVRAILDALYVYVDIRNTQPTGNLQDRIQKVTLRILDILCNMVVTKNEALKTTLENDWRVKLRGPYSVHDIIQYFTNLLGRKIFVHIDEIDYMVNGLVQGATFAERLQPYCDVWHGLLHDIVRSGICYVSGRSPNLFFAGNDAAQSEAQEYTSLSRSPFATYYLLFDRLLPHNIKNIIERDYQLYLNINSKLLTDAQVNTLARMISKWSAGVPRFVITALEFFKRKGDISELVTKDENKKWNSLMEHLERTIKAELDSYTSLPADKKPLYLKYTTDALLGIPHKIDLAQKDDYFRVLNELSQLGIYTALTPQIHLDEKSTPAPTSLVTYFYSVFPYAVAYYLCKHHFMPDIFLNNTSQLENVTLKTTGDWLELMTTQVIAYQIMNTIANTIKGTDQSIPIAKMFPFLHESALKEHVFVYTNQDQVVWRLPKFVDEKECNTTIEQAIDFIKLPANEIQPEDLTFKYSNWSQLLPHLKTGLYVPLSTSFSGDLYYFWKQPNGQTDILVFQCKYGKQQLSVASLQREMKKVMNIDLYSKGVIGKVVLVIVGQISSVMQKMFTKTDYALKLQPKLAQEANVWTNRALEVYVLTDKGHQILLSDFNYTRPKTNTKAKSKSAKSTKSTKST